MALFSSKQVNQTRITTFLHNLFQNYQVSLNYYFFVKKFSKYNKLYQQTMPFKDGIMSRKLYKHSKIINSITILVISIRKFGARKHFYKIFFSTHHLETHIHSFINKIYSNHHIPTLTPLKFFINSSYLLLRLWIYSQVKYGG